MLVAVVYATYALQSDRAGRSSIGIFGTHYLGLSIVILLLLLEPRLRHYFLAIYWMILNHQFT